MTKEEKKKAIQFALFAVAIACVVFALFAPSIFTRHGNLDFRNTGQIGDTIGGIMSPFIAIAGVIVAYLAFRMQKDANDIIVKQFNDTISNDKQIEETKRRRTIELMISDTNNSLKDIELRSKEIHSFADEINKDPFQTRILKRTPVSIYSRMNRFDRETLFNALVHSKSEKPIEILAAFYGIPDYMLPAISQISRICDSFEKDVFDGIMSVRENTAEIIKLFADSEKDHQSPTSLLFDDFVLTYHSVQANFGDHFYANMKLKYFEFERNITKLLTKDTDDPQSHLLKIRELLRQIESKYIDIEQQSKQIITSLNDAGKGLKEITGRCNFVLSNTKFNS